jgi:lipid-binding SYLF domain-containing protein
MQLKASFFVFLLLLCIPFAGAWADEFDDTIKIFKEAGESASFFDTSYGYAVLPSIGKAGIGIGGAHGKGRVYEQGKYIGDTTMTQLTVGFQLGGQVYSQMIFFKDKRALDEFTSGNFGFGGVGAVAITAGASVATTTTGSSAGLSGGKKDAATAGKYYKGVATFTVTKGGLMYEASIGGQKFSYKPKQ